MALDNAEFISELSILDPPGTDPLNQGDDHIRTTKKAVQQSFPNVGSAVPQTGAQMAQMAIKNEINTFTQQQRGPNGTAAAPAWTFSAGSGVLGMFRLGATVIGFGAGGVEVARISNTGITSSVDGSFAIPSYNFVNKTDMGMFRNGDTLAFVTDGLQQFRLGVGLVVFGAAVTSIRAGLSGNAADPMWSFDANPNMGMYRHATDQLGFATSGTQRALIKNNGIELMFGQVGAPAYSFNGDNDTGLYRPASNNLTIATGGTDCAAFQTSVTLSKGGVLMDDLGGTQTATINWRRAGFNRWRIVMSTDVNDNDLSFIRHNSSGVQQDVPLLFEGDTGFIIMSSLPTTNPGGSGRLWKSSGFVAIT